MNKYLSKGNDRIWNRYMELKLRLSNYSSGDMEELEDIFVNFIIGVAVESAKALKFFEKDFYGYKEL